MFPNLHLKSSNDVAKQNKAIISLAELMVKESLLVDKLTSLNALSFTSKHRLKVTSLISNSFPKKM